ncbi:MAG TPA: glycosyl hydrolase 53 family protein [Mucilaginibacter sp.]|jgi:arabinogalactan endo-1,4-beta-galactosidase
MKKGQLLIYFLFGVLFLGCSKSSPQPGSGTTTTKTTTTTPTITRVFAKGADIGWLSQMEASGKKFYDANRNQMDCIALLKSLGINSIRLRVWVNPAAGYCNKADVLAMAIRANNAGMKIMIDFHYSDTWADPGSQNKPAAWASLDLPGLEAAVYNHTYDVLSTLETNGVKPTWVQTGNEINNGLLWTTGEITGTGAGGAANYAALINSGYNAVKAVDTAIKTILHLSNGYDNSLFEWNLDQLKSNGGKWDITGMSSYPSTGGWAANNTSVLANMQDMIKRYGKPVMVCETGMDETAATTCGQMLTDMMTKTASLGNNGLGLFYWEPEAYGGWLGYNLVAFDGTGKPTVAMDAFSKTY